MCTDKLGERPQSCPSPPAASGRDCEFADAQVSCLPTKRLAAPSVRHAQASRIHWRNCSQPDDVLVPCASTTAISYHCNASAPEAARGAVNGTTRQAAGQRDAVGATAIGVAAATSGGALEAVPSAPTGSWHPLGLTRRAFTTPRAVLQVQSKAYQAAAAVALALRATRRAAFEVSVAASCTALLTRRVALRLIFWLAATA